MNRFERLALDLTQDQQMVDVSTREFARARLAPGAAARDQTATFPLELVQEAAKLGLLAMKVPLEMGGAGADNLSYALAMANIAEACASTAVILASSNLSSQILSRHATEAQRERWLRPLAEGRLGPISFALTEPGCGSDSAAITTAATRDGTHWVLNGSKMWITSAAQADLHLVFARSGGPGKEGVSCFVVERGASGLVIGREEDKMGQRASGTAALSFIDCRVPNDHQIGPLGGGYGMALSALGGGRVGIAALSLGLGEAAFEAGLAYATERAAFGKKLLEFQNTQFQLADSRTELDAAWLLMVRAAHLLDRGHRAEAETSMAKLFASEAAGRVIDRMVQVHGGYGYSREYVVERLYRDARVTRIYEGSSEIQRLIIARHGLEA